MKKLILAISSMFILAAAIAQDKVVNDPNAQVRNVSSFHGISVATGIHLYLTQGNDEKVAVSADTKEYRDKIVTEVVNGVLKIYYDNNHNWYGNDNNHKNLRAYVSCKMLDELRASSGAHVDVDGTIQSGNLALDFSSGASFKGNVNVKGIKIDASSGAHSMISGTADEARASTSSGSRIDAGSLVTNECDADASSGGHIEVTVNKSFSASASSGGHIDYKGDASIKTINTSSGGK